MEDKIRVLLTEEEVDEKIKKLGEKISEDYAGKSVHLICVLKGGAFLCVNLQSVLQCLYLWILCLYQAMATVQKARVQLRL